MRDEVKRDLGRSARLFKDVVYPEIEDWYGEGHVRMVEAETTTELAELLDQRAGIDAWHVESDAGMQSIASRVQDANGFNTYTIRKQRRSGAKTEFAKRKEAIANDYEHPLWTVQAYVDYDTEEIQNIGVCRTVDLFEYVRVGRKGVEWTTNSVRRNGAATFIVVQFGDLLDWREREYEMYVLDDSNLTRIAPAPEQADLWSYTDGMANV